MISFQSFKWCLYVIQDSEPCRWVGRMAALYWHIFCGHQRYSTSAILENITCRFDLPGRCLVGDIFLCGNAVPHQQAHVTQQTVCLVTVARKALITGDLSSTATFVCSHIQMMLHWNCPQSLPLRTWLNLYFVWFLSSDLNNLDSLSNS